MIKIFNLKGKSSGFLLNNFIKPLFLNQVMLRKLPIYKEYVMDERLSEFRTIENGRLIVIPFDSDRGQEILKTFFS